MKRSLNLLLMFRILNPISQASTVKEKTLIFICYTVGYRLLVANLIFYFIIIFRKLIQTLNYNSYLIKLVHKIWSPYINKTKIDVFVTNTVNDL